MNTDYDEKTYIYLIYWV